MENKKTNNERKEKIKYLFIPRKGQITISFLIIFVLLFSMFALTLYGSREMWASAKFRGAIDAAALSAGADMARGADLLITVTAIRVALFGVSMILYIASIPFPALFATATHINDLSRKISTLLREFSLYIPFTYLVKAEIDSYNIFEENFGIREQSSTNDYGIVVIPNYSISHIKEDDFRILPMPSELKDSVDMLKQGVSVFGYRKYSYLEQVKNNLNLKVSSTNNFEEWLNNHDLQISSASIGKTENGGVDLNDVLKIDTFLKIWEGPKKMFEEPKEDKAETTIENILKKAQGIVDKVDGIRVTIAFEDNDKYESSHNYQAVQEAKKRESSISCNNSKDIKDALTKWVASCKGQGEWTELFEGHINHTKLYASNADGHLAYLIEKYSDYLKQLKNPQEKPPEIGKLSTKIEDIESNAQSAKEDIEKAIAELKSHSTCIYNCGTDKDGKPITCTKAIDFSLTTSPMEQAKIELQDIINACEVAIKAIKEAPDQLNSETGKAATTVKNTLSSLMGGIIDVLTAFKGFPGGKTIAAIFGDFNCATEFKDLDPKYGSDKCLGCGIAVWNVGNIACGFQRDMTQFSKILNGDKFEIASYYSAHLEIPTFLSTEVNEINPNCGSLSGAINCTLDRVANNLNANIESQSLSASDIAVSIGGTIISGILSGGAAVVIGVILTTLTETVIEPLIEKKIVKLIPLLKEQISGIISKSLKPDVEKSIDDALGKFVYYHNRFQGIRLRLIGFNNELEINWDFVHFVNFISLRVASSRRLNIEYEENYSFA